MAISQPCVQHSEHALELRHLRSKFPNRGQRPPLTSVPDLHKEGRGMRG